MTETVASNCTWKFSFANIILKHFLLLQTSAFKQANSLQPVIQSNPPLKNRECKHCYLLSFPGYIWVYSTLYFLAKSMKAFIGLLHLLGEVAVTVLVVPELWLLPALPYKEGDEIGDAWVGPQYVLPSDLSKSRLPVTPQDKEARRCRAILLNT